LGHTIKVLRTDRGHSRRDLARLADISYSYVTDIENGRKPPSSPVLVRLAAALDVSTSELLAAAELRAETDILPSRRESFRGNPDEAVSAAQAFAAHDSPFAEPLPAGSSPRMALPRTADPLSPTARRLRSERHRREAWEQTRAPEAATGEQDHAEGENRGAESGEAQTHTERAIAEMAALMRLMTPEDAERLLDMARRLAR